MAKTFRVYIFATFVISCISAALLIVSFATNSWVVGDAEPQIEGTTDFKPSSVNYGLFGGTLERRLINTPSVYELYMTCVLSESVCALSCLNSAEEREDEIKSIIKWANSKGESRPEFHCNAITKTLEVSHIPDKGTLSPKYPDPKYIDSSSYVCTLVMLSIALTFSVISAALAITNTVRNPVYSILNIMGLYVWNAIAASFSTIVLIIWGVLFATNISKDLAIVDTLNGEFDSSGMSSLGYSYWIILPVVLMHLINIGILYYRQYLLSKEPPEPKIDFEEDADGRIFLF